MPAHLGQVKFVGKPSHNAVFAGLALIVLTSNYIFLLLLSLESPRTVYRCGRYVGSLGTGECRLSTRDQGFTQIYSVWGARVPSP